MSLTSLEQTRLRRHDNHNPGRILIVVIELSVEKNHVIYLLRKTVYWLHEKLYGQPMLIKAPNQAKRLH